MKDIKQGQKAHVLVVPMPGQGHINPMLQFSKRLAIKGIKITLTPTVCIFNSMHTSTIPTYNDQPIQVRPISDGYDDGGYKQAESPTAYIDSLRVNGSKTLAQLIKTLDEEGDPVTTIIYDGLLPWVLDVVKNFAIHKVVFFTQSCSVNSIYYHVQRGLIQLPLFGPGPTIISVPGVPELQPSEAPSFIHKDGSYPGFLDIALEQFSNIDQVGWVLCNIFL